MITNVLYDWFGYNKILFNSLNNITESTPILTTLKFITDYIGNYMMFPAHICLLVLIVYTITHKKNRNIEKEIIYIKSLMVLLTSLMLVMTIGELTKIYFSFVRPYCSPKISINSTVYSIMNVDYNVEKCFRSLPSGHTMYITTFVLGMWSAISKKLKILGIASIIMVAISRVILGTHFPADTFYGFALAASLVTVSRLVIKNMVMKQTLAKLNDILHT